MASRLNLWTREEILIAINLYHQLPFGQFDRRNKLVIKIAEKINRTPSSLALKLSNLASLDKSLDRKGMSNYSKLDKIVWDEFYNKLEETIFESEELINSIIPSEIEIDFNRKTESLNLIISRVNQSFFRKTVLSSYNNSCCISGVKMNSFLVASHIIPWKYDKENRLNPTNGMCLNILYDKAFDKGFITITPDFKILISEKITDEYNLDFFRSNFQNISNKKIILPSKFLPNKDFLDYHF